MPGKSETVSRQRLIALDDDFAKCARAAELRGEKLMAEPNSPQIEVDAASGECRRMLLAARHYKRRAEELKAKFREATQRVEMTIQTIVHKHASKSHSNESLDTGDRFISA
jgi:hypothetical protein